MKAPRATLENAEAVNAYYARKKPNKALMYLLHFGSARVYPTSVTFESDAEEMIGDHLAQGKQVFLAHNHQRNDDPFVLASIIQSIKVMHPMRTRTAIPGKSPLFNSPKYGWVIRHSGAIPVFRPQEHSPDVEEQRREAGDSLVSIMIDRFNNNYHGAIYPEGTRNPGDVTKLLPIRDGIGRIACGVDRPEDLGIVFVGTIYDGTEAKRQHSTVTVSQPYPVPSNMEAVTDLTNYRLQKMVDMAVNLAA